MAEYAVDVQTVDGNEESVSLTGTVNGVQVAAVYLARLEQGLKSGKLKDFRADKLVDAYLAKPAVGAGAAKIVVRRE